MKSQIEQILIPTTQRTLGSEKAVKSVAEENGSLKVALEFGYPVAHIAQQLHEAIAAATGTASTRHTTDPRRDRRDLDGLVARSTD